MIFLYSATSGLSELEYIDFDSESHEIQVITNDKTAIVGSLQDYMLSIGNKNPKKQ